MMGGQYTRKKTIDLAKLEQKMALSNSTCHHCRTIINATDENICTTRKKINGNKYIECSKRYCSDCLQKYYPSSWKLREAGVDGWKCPFCLESCKCYHCSRKKAKAPIAEIHEKYAKNEEFVDQKVLVTNEDWENFYYALGDYYRVLHSKQFGDILKINIEQCK